ncbi:MAG TPA: hypothetical protein VMW47_00200 [Verrucomicrobiae bacterium]|nr:hypothetical protein [Verrucomicrobiae bacterium]
MPRGFGLEIVSAGVEALDHARPGATATTARARARRTEEPLLSLSRLAAVGVDLVGTVAALLEEVGATRGSDRDLLRQRGRLPWLDRRARR